MRSAAHVSLCRVSRIDPAAETERYPPTCSRRSARASTQRGRALLEEDLRSPCTEEIAVFRAFARLVAGAEDGFVVLDTAPTGHTLLLLDAAEAYHRQVLRTAGSLPDAVTRLLPRLRDGQFTRVVIVTLPEATPVHEAERLQRDLRRAGIEPFAWVINQSFLQPDVRDPVLRRRGELERPYRAEVRDRLAQRVVGIPWMPEPPIGAAGLARLVGTGRDVRA